MKKIEIIAEDWKIPYFELEFKEFKMIKIRYFLNKFKLVFYAREDQVYSIGKRCEALQARLKKLKID